MSNPFMVGDPTSAGDSEADFHIPSSSSDRDQQLISKKYFEDELDKIIDSTMC